MPKEQPQLLPPDEMADRLSISRHTLGVLSRAGRIKPIRINKRVHRYDPNRVLEALNADKEAA